MCNNNRSIKQIMNPISYLDNDYMQVTHQLQNKPMGLRVILTDFMNGTAECRLVYGNGRSRDFNFREYKKITMKSDEESMQSAYMELIKEGKEMLDERGCLSWKYIDRRRNIC